MTEEIRYEYIQNGEEIEIRVKFNFSNINIFITGKG